MNNKYLFPSIIFIVSFVVYVITLNPTVTFTDNGELAGAAYSLGVAHPSGYPLFTILGHLWQSIPFPWTVIYKLNLLAAVYVSTSGVFLYLTLLIFLDNLKLAKVTELSGKRKKDKSYSTKEYIDSSISGTNTAKFIAFVSTLTLLFSNLVWSEATVYEVYSLQFLLINISLYFLLKGIVFSENHKRNMAISALFIGLSFSNHLTTILTIPAILYIYFRRPGAGKFDFSPIKFKNLLYLFLIVCVGVLFYLYLPLRSASEPDFNWGYVHRGFDKFMYHLQGKQYQVWMFSGAEIALSNLVQFLRNLANNFAHIGITIFCFGIYRVYKSYKEYFWFYIILLLSCVFYSINYSIHDIDVYFYLAVYSLVFFLAAGIVWFLEKFEKYAKYKYLILILPLVNLSVNFNNCDKSSNYLVYDYTRSVVDNLGENAIIISSQWDYWVSAFWYLQKVENYRPDITVIDKELLRRTWYPKQLQNWYSDIWDNCDEAYKNFTDDLEKFERGEDMMSYPKIQTHFEELLSCLIRSNIGKRPVYVTYDYMLSGDDASPLKTFNIVPAGFAFKLETFDAAIKVNLDKLQLDSFVKFRKDSKDHLESGILEVATLNLTNIARYAEATGDKLTADSTLRIALKVNPNDENAMRMLRELNRN